VPGGARFGVADWTIDLDSIDPADAGRALPVGQPPGNPAGGFDDPAAAAGGAELQVPVLSDECYVGSRGPSARLDPSARKSGGCCPFALEAFELAAAGFFADDRVGRLPARYASISG
jgi:hypothetical protein